MIQLVKSKWKLTVSGNWEYEDIIPINANEYQEYINDIIKKGENYCEEITCEGFCTVTISDNFIVRFQLISEKKHGGARPGAGRKKSGRSATLSFTIKPENKEYLEKRAKETGLTVTEVLETIIEMFIDNHKKK